MDATDVLAAAEQCARFLQTAIDANWDVPIPDMEWTVAQAIAHAAETPLWYAMGLSADADDWTPMELCVKAESAPTDLITTLLAASRVVAHVIAASPASARGFHPWGRADRSGFAALTCEELLIHTDDAGRGLGLPFDPDPALCARVLARLFPAVHVDVAPWDGLRWATGRIALPGLPRRQEWRGYSAPLDG